jgi:hypothetical protein
MTSTNKRFNLLIESFENIKDSHDGVIQTIIKNKDIVIVEFFPKIDSKIIENLKNYIESRFNLRCIIAEIPKFQHDQKYNFRIVRYDLIIYSRDPSKLILPTDLDDDSW